MLCHESISGITIKGKDAVLVGNLLTKLINFIDRNVILDGDQPSVHREEVNGAHQHGAV
jgi:hypothetical protein